MKKPTEETDMIVEDSDGMDYLCPLNTGNPEDVLATGAFDDCIEKDVVERYSANMIRQTASFV